MKRTLLLLACLTLLLPAAGCWNSATEGSKVERPDAPPEAFQAQPGTIQNAPPG